MKMQAVRIPIASNINSKNLGVVEKCNGRERESYVEKIMELVI
jgi:hypothetical protein